MDEKMIPYLSHEGDMVRMERSNRRLWIALLVVIVLFVASNVFWIWRDSQFEDVVVEQDVETDDGTAIVNGVGDMYYGTSETNNENPQEKSRR